MDGFLNLCDTFTDLLGVSDTFLALLSICIGSSFISSTSDRLVAPSFSFDFEKVEHTSILSSSSSSLVAQSFC
jgi:hypothetical protein